MNSRPEAWLRQAESDLAMAQLAKDHEYLAQACFVGKFNRATAHPHFPVDVAAKSPKPDGHQFALSLGCNASL